MKVKVQHACTCTLTEKDGWYTNSFKFVLFLISSNIYFKCVYEL